MSHWLLSLSCQTSKQRNRWRMGEGCCKSSKLSWWQLYHPLPGYQWNSGTCFTGFRVHQECLLFTEKTEREAWEKSIWGIFNFEGVCEAYFPAKVLGISTRLSAGMHICKYVGIVIVSAAILNSEFGHTVKDLRSVCLSDPKRLIAFYCRARELYV